MSHDANGRLGTPAGEAGPLAVLTGLLRPSLRRLTVAVIAYLLKDSPLWVLPAITAGVIDTVVNGGTLTRLLLLGAGALALVLLNYPVSQVFVKATSTTVRGLGLRLRSALADRLQELSIGFHNRSSSSVLQTKLVRDVENVELMLQQGANPFLSAVGIIVGAVTILALQVPLALVLFALLVPLSVGLVRGVRRRSEERNETFRRDVELLSSQVGEMASLLPITRAHGLEYVAAERLASTSRSVRDSGFSLDVLNGRFTALAWVAFQGLSIACLIGAGAVSLTGILPITPGQVVLVSTYFVMLTNAIVNLLNLAPLVTKGRESLRSVSEVLEEPDVEQNRGKTVVAEPEGRIRFASTSFRYDEGAPQAVDDLDLEIAPGETVAFVGPSGSGKSTVLNLALGFLRPTAGAVLLDGADLQSLDLRTVRRRVSVVPQESALISGSVRDNVTFGLGEVEDAVVQDALRDANALDFVLELPGGVNAQLGPRGAQLSGGQRQRLSIARALVRDPRILFLDEATSALDSESEAMVREALARLRQGRTTLVVAHRLSTIRSADRIAVLEQGRLVELGSHEELIAAGGVYSRLHALQAG